MYTAKAGAKVVVRRWSRKAEEQDAKASGRTVRERVDLGGLVLCAVDAAEAGEGVDAVDVHGTRAADALSARAAEGEGGVDLVLDADQGVEHWMSHELGQLVRERDRGEQEQDQPMGPVWERSSS